MNTSLSTRVIKQLAGGVGLLFSCFIIYSITVALLDEAVARFISVAVGFAVALMGNPLAGRIEAERWREQETE